MSSFDNNSSTTSTDAVATSKVDDAVDALIDGAAKIAILAETATTTEVAVAPVNTSATAVPDTSADTLIDSVSAAAVGAVDLTSDKPIKAKANAHKSLAAHLSAGHLFHVLSFLSS